jgi:hypothetical protein
LAICISSFENCPVLKKKNQRWNYHNILLYHSGIHPKEFKSAYITDICTLMFFATLFTNSRQWNQTRYPIIKKLIKKIQCIYTIIIQPQRRIKFLLFSGKWMKLEIITLSEISQAQTNIT